MASIWRPAGQPDLAVRARLKLTADHLDEGADCIAKFEITTTKASADLPVIAWQVVEPLSLTYNKPFGGTKATPLCDQEVASARIAELEHDLLVQQTENANFIAAISRLEALLAESQAALSEASKGLMELSLEARGLGQERDSKIERLAKMDHLIDDSDHPLPMPPIGHPLHTLGVLLGRLLDEDQWVECERLLLLGWDQDRIDRKTGAAWRTNSSLELWFPITASSPF
jgi:hypothetical protein